MRICRHGRNHISDEYGHITREKEDRNSTSQIYKLQRSDETDELEAGSPTPAQIQWKREEGYCEQQKQESNRDRRTKSRDTAATPNADNQRTDNHNADNSSADNGEDPSIYGDYPYLLQRHPISYSYSATVLLNQIQRQDRREVPEKGVLAFAASYPKQLSPDSYSYQRSGNIARVREGLSPLPGAEEEVTLLEKHLWGAFFQGDRANETNFKQKAHQYSIIHLAMHGVLNNNYPILSSLVFSEDSSEVEDNFLRAYEIAQMELNADLVVLSACETGYGKFQQGEGVMSLAHSFAYAGASSVLMSLWQVNDHSTSEIMKEYYTHLAKTYPKDYALQHAKLHYIDHSPENNLAHPAFWAAFVQTGNTASLELVAHTGKTFRQMHYLAMGGGVLALVLLFFGVRRFRRQ